MVMPVILFIVGLVLLIKGGDWFVDGATGIAERFHVPELLIGATVVSIGTTLPEVMVSANSALSGHGEIAYGNALGSIICNTALIAAITVAVRPAKVDGKTLRIPVAFFFGAMLIYMYGAYIQGTFARPTGLILLAGFAVYMFILIRQALEEMKQPGKTLDTDGGSIKHTKEDRSSASDNADTDTDTDTDKDNNIDIAEDAVAGNSDSYAGKTALDTGGINTGDIDTGDTEETGKNKDKDDRTDEKPQRPLLHDIIYLILGAAFIAEGADLLVDNGTLIAQAMGVPEAVIALTFVALGTSLPELVTAITSLAKGHGALSLGNVCGANLFNLVLVSGLSITLSPFGLPSERTLNIGGNPVNASLAVDLPVSVFVMLILTIPALIKGELKRWQGVVLLTTYAAFCIFQFM